MIQPRDFLETVEGLFFAALSPDVAFLRYYPSEDGSRKRGNVRYEKVRSTEGSFEYLLNNYPQYVFKKSSQSLQGCPPGYIARVYSPAECLKKLFPGVDAHSRMCLDLNETFGSIPQKKKGVTGSFLVGLHTHASDIDFVIYGVKNFIEAQEILAGEEERFKLTKKDWHAYFNKRFHGKSPFTVEEFVWHEERKHNIGKIEGTLFNLLLVDDSSNISLGRAVKRVVIRCRVTDAGEAFNIPAVYVVDHDDVTEVVSYTHTYTGQAREGEMIEASGVLEKDESGLRLVVGTTREAEGEYIKVIQEL